MAATFPSEEQRRKVEEDLKKHRVTPPITEPSIDAAKKALKRRQSTPGLDALNEELGIPASNPKPEDSSSSTGPPPYPPVKRKGVT